MMAGAAAAGEIDLFCVGEPWGSESVESGAAELILAGSAIWRFAPEKALVVGADWLAAEPDAAGRLLRAVWRAARWLGEKQNRLNAAEILAWPDYVGVAPEVIERALSGRSPSRQRATRRVRPTSSSSSIARPPSPGAARPYGSRAVLRRGMAGTRSRPTPSPGAPSARISTVISSARSAPTFQARRRKSKGRSMR